MKEFRQGVILCLLLIAIISVSCEAVFTFNVFSILKRDASSLSQEQQINYIDDALSAGNDTVLTEAYAVVTELLESGNLTIEQTIELTTKATDIAIKRSGIEDVILNDDLLEGINLNSDSNSSSEQNSSAIAALQEKVVAALTKINTEVIDDMTTHIESLESNNATVTTNQYVIVSIGLVASVAKDNEALLSTDSNDTNMTQVLSNLDANETARLVQAGTFLQTAQANADENDSTITQITSLTSGLGLPLDSLGELP